MNVAKHWHVAGEVFAISDCLVGIGGCKRNRRVYKINLTRIFNVFEVFF